MTSKNARKKVLKTLVKFKDEMLEMNRKFQEIDDLKSITCYLWEKLDTIIENIEIDIKRGKI